MSKARTKTVNFELVAIVLHLATTALEREITQKTCFDWISNTTLIR